MNALWQRLNAWFDALAKRERIVVFAGAILVVALLGNQFFIEPHLVRHAALTKNLAQQRQARVEIQANLISGEARAREPDAQNRAALQGLRDRIAKVDSEYRAVQESLVAPEKMAEHVETLLRRNRGLRMVGLETLPPTPVTGKPQAGTAEEKKPPADASKPAAEVAGLYKHGVRITVRGSYADMIEYLVQLERLPQKMYWGSVELLTEEYPVSLLQLTVYTLSASKSWLVI